MKSHNTVRMVIAGTIFAIVAGVGAIEAQEKESRSRQWWQNQDVQQALNLSAEQIADITNLNQKLRTLGDANLEVRRAAWQTLRDSAANPEGNQFKAAADAYLRSFEDHASLSIERLLGLTSILTADQIANLSTVAPGALAPRVVSSSGSSEGLRSAGLESQKK